MVTKYTTVAKQPDLNEPSNTKIQRFSMHPCGLAIIQAWVASALRNDSLNIEGRLTTPRPQKPHKAILKSTAAVVIITAAVVINYGPVVIITAEVVIITAAVVIQKIK